MPIVVKFGGNALTNPEATTMATTAIRTVVDRGMNPIVVHGGGPFIARALDEAGIEHRFLGGLRVTTPASLPIIERVLTLLGKELAQRIGPGIGLSGRDAGLLIAAPFDPSLGHVGHITQVNTPLLINLTAAGFVPVIACLALGADGNLLNVNADEVAAAVAGSLAAPVLFLTNVPGVLSDPGDSKSLLRSVARSELEALVRDGRIAGGMIPKVKAALAALERGAPQATIAAIEQLPEALTAEAGTRICLA